MSSNIVFTRPAGRFYRFRTVITNTKDVGQDIIFRIAPINGSAFKVLWIKFGPDNYATNESVLVDIRNEDLDKIGDLITDTAVDNNEFRWMGDQPVVASTVVGATASRMGWNPEGIVGHSDLMNIQTFSSLADDETLTVEFLLLVFGEIPTKTLVNAETSKVDDFEFTY